MPQINQRSLERAGGALLAVVCAAVAATCAGSGALHRAPAVAPSVRPAAASAPAAIAASAPVAVPSAAAAPQAWSRFCGAVGSLANHTRQSQVRVLWLGDSHTYADFWTHAVRRALQERYGNGGPGFVHLGLQKYRHGGVKPIVDGEWRQEPAAPSRSSRSGDGVFGLGGIRAVPEQESARAGLELYRGAVVGGANYQIWYRLPDARAGFRAEVDSRAPRTVRGPGSSEVQTLRLHGDANGKLVLTEFLQSPQLLGVAVESDVPGVVLDTLGINGARAATPLGWEASAWVALVKQRAPDLVVLAYGTNEVVAAEDPGRYAAHFAALLERIRGAVPEVDCLLVGPTDVGQGEETSNPRVAAIDDMERRVADRIGCRYFSVFGAMGGEGSSARWARAQPPLARSDHVHLTQEGYQRIGDKIAESVLGTCR